MGGCAFGDECRRSHRGELKEANANNDYNEVGSSSYESPVENSGIARSNKGSAGGGEDEDVQDSLPSGHVLDPLPSKEIDIDEECAEPDVQDSGPSRDDVLDPPPSNLKEIIVDRENADDKEPCIFFRDGSCGYGSACDFSHSIPDDTEPRDSGRPKGPSKSFYHIFTCRSPS